MHAFILAGGFATRLWPLTEKRAKPLLPLAGKPMLSWIVEGIPRGIPVTVSTNAAFGEDFEHWRQSIGRQDIDIVIEQTGSDDEKLGTNGAIAQWIAGEGIDDDLLLLTGDNYLGFSMQSFIDAYRPDHPLLAAYDIGDLRQASSFGTVLTGGDGSTVTGFEEKPKDPKTTLVSTGCYVLPRSALPILTAYAKDHPDHIGGIFEEFLRRNIPVDCFRFNEPWFDVGSFQSYLDATRTLVGERALVDPSSVVSQTDTHGSIVIGKGCTVRESELEHAVLFDGCTVEDCVLRDCVIDDGCVLRGVDLTGKMVRAGTRLERRPTTP